MSAGIQPDCLGGREIRKFDSMNRVVIPAPFRSRYGNVVYLFKNFQNNDCVVVYSEEDYLKVYNGIAKTYTGAELAFMQNLFTDHIDMCVIDKAGRITLKQDFLDFAEMEDEALVICQPNRIELWNEEKWNAQFKPEAMPDLSKFNISPTMD